MVEPSLPPPSPPPPITRTKLCGVLTGRAKELDVIKTSLRGLMLFWFVFCRITDQRIQKDTEEQ